MRWLSYFITISKLCTLMYIQPHISKSKIICTELHHTSSILSTKGKRSQSSRKIKDWHYICCVRFSISSDLLLIANRTSDLLAKQIRRPICFWLANRTSDLIFNLENGSKNVENAFENDLKLSRIGTFKNVREWN